MIMKLWCLIIASFAFFQATAKAESIYTTVFNVFESIKTERLLVLSSSDGRIYKTAKSDENLELMKSYVGKIVKLDFVDRGEESIITNIQLAKSNEIDQATMDLNHFRYNELRQFAPTDLQSVENATNVFNNMLNDGDKSRSQCFKRAHMWAFDMWSKLGVSSEKIFIFYTERYQIIEEEKWWFHVAPMVTVQGVQYVMDGTFMKKPITVQEWKDYFIKSDKITCPVVSKYQDMGIRKDKDNNDISSKQWSKLCYLMKVPMYHFSPLDIQNRDENKVKRNSWVLEELQDARRAFKNWDSAYEGYDTGRKVPKF